MINLSDLKGGGSPVKSIQRNTFHFNVTTGGNATITVTSVDVNKSYLLSNIAADRSDKSGSVGIKLLNSTTIRLDNYYSGTSDAYVNWQLVELN